MGILCLCVATLSSFHCLWHLCLDIPYSGKLSREKKTFANFAVLWVYTKVFSAKFGAWHSLALQKQAIRESFLCENRILTNLRKFSPSKVSRYTVTCVQWSVIPHTMCSNSVCLSVLSGRFYGFHEPHFWRFAFENTMHKRTMYTSRSEIFLGCMPPDSPCRHATCTLIAYCLLVYLYCPNIHFSFRVGICSFTSQTLSILQSQWLWCSACRGRIEEYWK